MDAELANRKLRASLAASASWRCTCEAASGAVDRSRVQHAPDCRYRLHLLAASRGGESTLRRHGRSHFHRLRLIQLARRGSRHLKGVGARSIYPEGGTP